MIFHEIDYFDEDGQYGTQYTSKSDNGSIVTRYYINSDGEHYNTTQETDGDYLSLMDKHLLLLESNAKIPYNNANTMNDIPNH